MRIWPQEKKNTGAPTSSFNHAAIKHQKGLLQLMRTLGLPLGLMSETVLIAMTNLRPMVDQTMTKKGIKGNFCLPSNNCKLRNLNRTFNQEDETCRSILYSESA